MCDARDPGTKGNTRCGRSGMRETHILEFTRTLWIKHLSTAVVLTKL